MISHRAWTLLFRLGVGISVLAAVWWFLEWVTRPLFRAWEILK
jgi:hypothetical protein